MSVIDEPSLSDNAMQTLRARYLLKDDSGCVTESPGRMFRRVARFVSGAEIVYGATCGERKRIEKIFCNFLCEGRFLPNSPTLMNAERRFAMLSACFVLPIGDSIESIFDSVKSTAQIQKAGGGTGFSFDRLRPTGDLIASSGGKTSGPISFWRVFCEVTRAIQQGAFRRGANMAMMHIGHPDILKFITAKNDLTEFENFNVSLKVTEQFMAALRSAPAGLHVLVRGRDLDFC